MYLKNYPLFKENEVSGDFHIQLAPIGTAGMIYFSFNRTHPDKVLAKVYSDDRWNEAMSIALNRDEMNEVVFLGQGEPQALVGADPSTATFVSDDMLKYKIEYNPKKAEKLLDDMGLMKGKDGFRRRPDGEIFILLLQFSTQGAPPELMSLVKEYWEAVGVKCQLKEVNSDLYWDLLRDYKQDICVWHANGTTPPGIYARASVIPPYNDDFIGQQWANYMNTNGAEGDELLHMLKNSGLYSKILKNQNTEVQIM